MSNSALLNHDREQAIARFKAEWAEYVRLGDLADAAFLRWFRGETKNGAAASRLQNRVSYQSAEVHSAANRLYALDIDPETIEPEYQP